MSSELQQAACYNWVCNQQSDVSMLFSDRKATGSSTLQCYMGKGTREQCDSGGPRHLSDMFLCPTCREIFRCVLSPLISSKMRWMKSRP